MPLKPNDKKAVREAIADFCLRAEKNQIRWHYTQARPFSGFGREPEQNHANDCSGYCSLAFNYAMHEVGVYMGDPLGMRYSGWGWTGSQIEWLDKHGGPAPVGKYLIGDMAFYGTRWATVHVTICRVAGNRETAVFSSNGNENAPQPTKVGYLDDLVGVWRHGALQ